MRLVGSRPNILFINTDQQTWNAISAYGNPHVRTPSIDRLHRNGVSFMRSYCTDPVCAPARASWMTGLYTSENGVPFNGGGLHEDIPDLGQVLQRNGYLALHCGKWHVDGRAMRASFHNLCFGKRDIHASNAEAYDRVSTHAVIDFLDCYDQQTPFYLQLGLINPHDICEYQHNHEYKRIPGPVEQGLLAPDDLPPLPKNVFENQHFVSGVDLLPTVLDYAGIEAPDGVQGVSLRPLVEGRDVPWRDCAYVESNYWARAIVTERFKYVMEYRPKAEEDFVPPGLAPDRIGLEQLFDLEGDPWETRNLAGDQQHARALSECRDTLLRFEARLQRRRLREGRPCDIVRRWGGPLRQRWAALDR